MKSPSKYKFHNVLVADTRLLWPMEAGGQQPDVLVLTNKLFKCPPRQTTNCSSCCLHVERPEFRRRTSFGSDADTGSGECFANCGRRRSVDVELQAKDQLSGKLVILAFTRIDHSSSLTGSPTTAAASNTTTTAAIVTTTKCQTLNTWSFGRFEPNSSISDPKQVSFARFSHSQSPTMLITSLEISWSPDDQHKELISLTINPNIHHQRLHRQSRQQRQRQQVATKETLLVSELECSQRLEYNQNASFYDDTRDSSSDVTTFKVHLLTLINRQLSSASTPSLAALDGSPQSSTSHRTNSQPKVPATDVASESYIDYPVSASTLVVGRASTTPPVPVVTKSRPLVSSTTAGRSHHRPTNHDQPPISTRRPPDELQSGFVQLQVPFLHNKYEFKANESSNMGPSYLSEHDLTRIRLKSNGFLVLAISSSLVILIYTLCLIAYLRWRHRVRSKNRSMAADNAVVPIRKVELDISEPYNLQMPSATRTRLDMMLRGCIVPSEYNNPTSYGREEPSNSTSTSIGGHAQKGRVSKKSRNQTNENKYHEQDSVSPYYKISHVEERPTGGKQSQRKQRGHSNFGSINVVRAIRQAATLARSRLHLNTRYRPNLNVIFESDLEYLQSPRGELYRGLFNQDNLVYISPTRKSKEAQIDTLVENAMRSDCSHYVDKQQHSSGSRMQTTATLFSKPIEETDPATAVSRSQILRQVKQEDMFGNSSSVRAEL